MSEGLFSKVLALRGEVSSCVVLGSFILLAFFALNTVQAAPPVIPPSGTPGGVQPDLHRKVLPSTMDPGGFPIPPVIERPLGIDEGPKVDVARFQLRGVTDHPDRGISTAEIQSLLSKRISEKQGSFTIGQLQEVANEVTRYYRSAGFILAQAFIPEQNVDNQTVVMQVLEGKLGSIQTSGNSLYSTDILASPFYELVGEAVVKDKLESGLMHLTDYPGVSVFGVFKPGGQVGKTDLILNVQEEKQFEGAIQGDNYGIETTGEWRATLEGRWNNMTGAGDQLSGTVLKTLNPSEATFGGIDYMRPILGPEYKFGIGVSRNVYDITGALSSLDLSGTTDRAYVNLRHSFIRGREKNLYGLVELNHQDGEVQQAGAQFAEDKITVGVLELGFDTVDKQYSGINQGSVRYSHGFPDFLDSMDELGDGKSLRVLGDGTNVGGDFDKFNLNLVRLQGINKNHSLLLSFQGQTTSDPLPSLEQMSLGGPNSVRAYPVSEFLYDKAWFASAEWIMNAPGVSDRPAFSNRTWGEVLQLSLFFDIAGGSLNNKGLNEIEGDQLKGAGGAIQLSLPGEFFTRLDVATNISDDDPSNDRSVQYWLTGRLEF
jgi:hemolysin activation/secretion protein